MLALLKDGIVVSEVPEGNAFDLPDGRHVSTAIAGWYSIQPMPAVQSDEEGEEAAAPVVVVQTETRDGYELAAIAEADPVPAGKRVVSTSVDLTSGSPKYVHVLADMTSEEIWAPVRAERDARLATCDWTQLADCPLSAETRTGWAVYRQALRDLPDVQTDPADVVWPTPPV